jgi:hypothetical protein
LTCAECGRQQTEGERGWRAYLTVDDADDPEPVEAVVLCPGCAAREFGAPPPAVEDVGVPRAASVCGAPNCPNVAVRAGRCLEHAPKPWLEASRALTGAASSAATR